GPPPPPTPAPAPNPAASPPTVGSPQGAAPSTADTAPNRILIVDDQPDLRRLCRFALSGEGMECDEAASGPDAVARAAKKPFDVVLLDVDLPGFSGEEGLRRLRPNPPAPH